MYSQLIITTLIIILGYVVKKTGVITEKEGQVLSKLVIYVTLPALVLDTFNGIKFDFSLGLLPVICILYGGLTVTIALIAFKNEGRNLRGVLSMAASGFNIGLFAFPIAQVLWGDKGVQYLAMFDVGNAFLIYGACYVLACIFSPDRHEVDVRYIIKRLTTFFPLILYVLTLALNLVGIHFSGVFIDFVKSVSKANMPLSLLILGIYFNISVEKGYWTGITKVLLIRFGIGLCTGVILYLTLPFELAFRQVLVMIFMLPMGFSTIPYSSQFGYDVKFAGALVNTANILSYVLIWGVFSLRII